MKIEKIVVIASIILTASLSYGFEVSIVNPSFEDPVLSDSTFIDTILPGWTKDKPSSSYRIYNPANSFELQANHEQNFAWLAAAGSSAQMSQTTTETIQANTVYELQIDIGCLASTFGIDAATNAYYTIVWYATDGAVSTQLASSGTVTVPSPTWTTVKMRFNSVDNASLVGRYFKIVLAGKKVMFDNVKIIGGATKILTIGTTPAEIGINTVKPVWGAYACYQGEIVNLEAFSFVNCPEVYTFTGWTGAVSTPASDVTTITMDADKTITANFVLDGRNCYEKQSGIVIKNPSFEIPLVPEDGYQQVTSLSGWTIDATDKVYTVYDAASGATFSASNGQNHLGMQLAGAGSGQISQTSLGTIQANTVYEFKFDVAAFDVAGYYVVSVYASPRSPSHLLATTGTSYLSSTYTWNTITVTWDSTATPEWVGSAFDIVVGGKRIFLDNFRVTPAGQWTAAMNLNIQTQPASLASYVSPSAVPHSYDYGSVAYLNAVSTPKLCPAEYIFDGWTENGNVIGTNPSISSTMNSDRLVTAHYVLNPNYVPVCGDSCRPIVSGDANKDCKVNLIDIAEIAKYWLQVVQ